MNDYDIFLKKDGPTFETIKDIIGFIVKKYNIEVETEITEKGIEYKFK